MEYDRKQPLPDGYHYVCYSRLTKPFRKHLDLVLKHALEACKDEIRDTASYTYWDNTSAGYTDTGPLCMEIASFCATWEWITKYGDRAKHKHMCEKVSRTWFVVKEEELDLYCL